MAGSPTSKARSPRRWLLALLASIALIAAACGGEADPAESAESASDPAIESDIGSDTAPETTAPVVEAVEAGDSDAVAVDEVDAVDDEPVEVDEPTTAGEAAEAAADGAEAAVELETAAEAADTADESSDPPSGLAQVLALAADNSESQSYSFTQGMAMQMNMLGQQMDIAPEGPYVFGEVENGMTHLNMDMGILMTSIFDSIGIDVSQPPFDEMFAVLDEANIEMWSDEQTLVMDMSSFASSIGSLDPDQAAELGQFADGPVLVDLTQLDGVDAAEIANQFGNGAQIVDPAQVLATLQDANLVTQTGSSQVNGVDVAVFTASLSFADYSEAMGVDLTEQLSTFGMQDATSESDAAMYEAMLPAMEQLMVDIEVMVDGDDLVRRIQIDIDMGAMMTAMFNDPAILQTMADEEDISVEEMEAEMSLAGFGDIELTTTTWQEFDNYGESFDIALPEAVDITNEFDLAS